MTAVIVLVGLLSLGFGGPLSLQYAEGNTLSLFTSPFFHKSVDHLALNLSGLMCVLWLWRKEYQKNTAALLLICLLSHVFLPVLTTSPVWGFSGSVHGMFVYMAVIHGFEGKFSSKVFLVLGVLLKVWLEIYSNTPGLSWGSHLSGITTGLVVAICQQIAVSIKPLVNNFQRKYRELFHH